MENNLLVAISGGRSSAMMSYLIHHTEKYKKFNVVYCFANTGMERPETIEFLKNIEKYWNLEIVKIEGVYSEQMGIGVDYKIVEWDELSMDAKPFEGAIKHLNKGTFDGLPNSASPYCSKYLKTLPSKKLGDAIYGLNNYQLALGYRAEDMPKRISWAEIKADTKRIFPLLTDFEKPITQSDLNRFWDAQHFKLGIHSTIGNCELCWKKGTKSLIKSINNGTRFIEWMEKMERKYNNTMYRNKQSIKDIVKLAKLPTTKTIEFDDDNDNCVCTFQ
jgi:hypothetical protein